MDMLLENISAKVGINGAPLKKLSSAEKRELKVILLVDIIMIILFGDTW